MSNYPIWNVRLRHEWLATPLKKRRVKRRSAARIGLLQARERRTGHDKAEPSAEALPPAETTS
ncbi:MAG: hypothetical protein HY744_16405 [Deltaproteobacteria bacterium]|nr:hypothetical protein [Deltaproteobacteria bacterium]